MPTDSINGTALAYDLVGDGPPLVLVHGSWSQRQAWGFVLAELAASFRVVNYDRRGHGESTASPDAGTVHDDVADLAGLIELLGIAPAHVVAHSYGSCVALRLAAEHPQLVARIVCHEPPLLGLLETSPKHQPLVEETGRNLGEVQQLLERGDAAAGAELFVERVALGPGAWAFLPPEVQSMLIRNAGTFLGELRDRDAFRAEPESLKQVRVPVLLTQGGQSAPMFAPIIEVLAELLPDVRRQSLSGAGHLPHRTHADEYVPIVRDFLDDGGAESPLGAIGAPANVPPNEYPV